MGLTQIIVLIHKKMTKFVGYKYVIMSIWRVILSIIFPPIAVYDKGCGSILIVLLLTLAGWIPGVIGALVILNNPKYNR